MVKVKDKEVKQIKDALEFIYKQDIDIDEFVGVDIYDMERALRTGDTELENFVEKILQKHKETITEPGVYEFILGFAEDNAPLLYEKLKDI
ncbi:MAG TPA: hypothetical protein DEP48_02880 [Persephonella sp.]|uniref:hypothetical protein n=1 Tax=Persephonella TaxID=182899 RepID=UPI00059F836D|nr:MULTISPECIES: hypothetical protein [Persephonella]HCB69282.1 hypothetical protein [Persephonella sp.]